MPPSALSPGATLTPPSFTFRPSPARSLTDPPTDPPTHQTHSPSPLRPPSPPPSHLDHTSLLSNNRIHLTFPILEQLRPSFNRRGTTCLISPLGRLPRSSICLCSLWSHACVALLAKTLRALLGTPKTTLRPPSFAISGEDNSAIIAASARQGQQSNRHTIGIEPEHTPHEAFHGAVTQIHHGQEED
jgi:hypothetical protein